TSRLHAAVLIDDHDAGGIDLRDTAIERRWMRDVAVGEVRRHLPLVDIDPRIRVREDGFDFRAEEQPVTILIDEERLFSRAIAREDEAPGARVPDRDGEHAVDLLDELRSHV